MQVPECHRCFGPIVRLLIVTGQRREEISGLHWQELDRAGREMRLSGDRTKNGEPTTIPLNDLAVAELDKVATRLRFTVQPASRSNAVTRR
nr:tyrosine-type recombinase/integrase [Sphingobium sp. LB126]